MVNIRNSATMTPAGFPWYDQWGSARYASNNAFLHAVGYSEPSVFCTGAICFPSPTILLYGLSWTPSD